MTSMELLNSLNSIRDRYILEAKDIGNKGKSRNTLPSSGPAAEPLPFSAEKTSRRYQAKDSTKRKKNGLKRLLVLSTAAGLLLAALAGRGTIAGWADYFETFLNRTENPYQYTQPVDITTPSQTESAFEDDANTPSIDGTTPSLEAAAEEHLQLLFGNLYPFYFLETNREEFSLSDYCTEESERLGLSVGITRYALLDLDGDQTHFPHCPPDWKECCRPRCNSNHRISGLSPQWPALTAGSIDQECFDPPKYHLQVILFYCNWFHLYRRRKVQNLARHKKFCAYRF